MELKKDQKAGEVVDVTCSRCKRSTKHKILTDILAEGYEAKGQQFIYSWDDEYQIIQCQGCETLSFRTARKEFETPDETSYNIKDVCVYPKPDKVRSSLRVADIRLLPGKLLGIYSETLVALNEELPLLAAMGIRAIVETVCKDKNATGPNLQDKIDDLVTRGVLTQEGADILHKLRTLGNDAAHEVKPHDNVQLGLALDVIHHLLQGVYTLPHRSKQQFQ